MYHVFGHVNQLPNLVADGIHDARRAMSQKVAAPARKKVEIPVTLGVPDPRPFAPHQTDRVPPIIRDHIAVELRDGRLGTLIGQVRRRQGNISMQSGSRSMINDSAAAVS